MGVVKRTWFPASASRCCKPQFLSSSLSKQFCISETPSNSTCRRREEKRLWILKKIISVELKNITSGYINMERWRSMFFCPCSNLAKYRAQISQCHHTLSNTTELQNLLKEVQKIFPATFQHGTPSQEEEDTQRFWEAISKPQGKSVVNLLRFFFFGSYFSVSLTCADAQLRVFSQGKKKKSWHK